jgi:hypothetical protein
MCRACRRRESRPASWPSNTFLTSCSTFSVRCLISAAISPTSAGVPAMLADRLAELEHSFRMGVQLERHALLAQERYTGAQLLYLGEGIVVSCIGR